jgi:hypothetical protein
MIQTHSNWFEVYGLIPIAIGIEVRRKKFHAKALRFRKAAKKFFAAFVFCLGAFA